MAIVGSGSGGVGEVVCVCVSVCPEGGSADISSAQTIIRVSCSGGEGSPATQSGGGAAVMSEIGGSSHTDIASRLDGGLGPEGEVGGAAREQGRQDLQTERGPGETRQIFLTARAIKVSSNRQSSSPQHFGIPRRLGQQGPRHPCLLSFVRTTIVDHRAPGSEKQRKSDTPCQEQTTPLLHQLRVSLPFQSQAMSSVLFLSLSLSRCELRGWRGRRTSSPLRRPW